jgi:IS30 family transposase
MNNYTHISLEEREIIYNLKLSWVKQYKIAKELGRDPGTISRELDRNKTLLKGKNAKKEKIDSDYHYLPDRADMKTKARRVGRGRKSPMENSEVYQYVIIWLTEKWWSPDIISGMIKAEYPDNTVIRISHECIYQFIYSRAGEKLNLKSYLLRSHRKRKEKTGRSVRGIVKTRIPGRIDIDKRPVSILTREEFGHWEWDSVLSGIKAWATLHTELERKSRFLMVKKIAGKTALLTLDAMKNIFSPLPFLARITLTLDNGTENVKHQELTAFTWMLVYYAKPYHSWERGSNEHSNGMIRRYFPKGTDFSLISDEQIQKVVNYLNNRPRKILW